MGRAICPPKNVSTPSPAFQTVGSLRMPHGVRGRDRYVDADSRTATCVEGTQLFLDIHGNRPDLVGAVVIWRRAVVAPSSRRGRRSAARAAAAPPPEGIGGAALRWLPWSRRRRRFRLPASARARGDADRVRLPATPAARSRSTAGRRPPDAGQALCGAQSLTSLRMQAKPLRGAGSLTDADLTPPATGGVPMAAVPPRPDSPPRRLPVASTAPRRLYGSPSPLRLSASRWLSGTPRACDRSRAGSRASRSRAPRPARRRPMDRGLDRGAPARVASPRRRALADR